MAEKSQWVQADLQCLLCGRVLGRLAGASRYHSLAVAVYAFSVFRPADSRLPVRRLRGNEQFRCDVCGGNAVVEEIERFTTYDEAEEASSITPRRGRHPTPMRRTTDWRLVELGLAS